MWNNLEFVAILDILVLIAPLARDIHTKYAVDMAIAMEMAPVLEQGFANVKLDILARFVLSVHTDSTWSNHRHSSVFHATVRAWVTVDLKDLRGAKFVKTDTFGMKGMDALTWMSV